MKTPYLDMLIKEREEWLKEECLFGIDKEGLIELKAIKEALSMPRVVQQRELLLAFHRTLVDDFTQEHEWYTREQIVDDFLKSQE